MRCTGRALLQREAPVIMCTLRGNFCPFYVQSPNTPETNKCSPERVLVVVEVNQTKFVQPVSSRTSSRDIADAGRDARLRDVILTPRLAGSSSQSRACPCQTQSPLADDRNDDGSTFLSATTTTTVKKVEDNVQGACSGIRHHRATHHIYVPFMHSSPAPHSRSEGNT